MPAGLGITVGDFVREAREDQASPTTSTFVHRIPHCRETVNRVEEVRCQDVMNCSPVCFSWEVTAECDKCARCINIDRPCSFGWQR